MNESKKKILSASLKATRLKRTNQICRVFEVKLDESHLNKTTKAELDTLFLEAKWLYNHVLSQEDIFNVDSKIDKVQIKVKEETEDRELKVIGSQMKQSVVDSVKQNILNLSKRKDAGYKVGKLNFKSYCNSIDLKQFGNTYRINGNKIKIQGIKKYFVVRGLNQINSDYEIANAKIVKRSSGYYFKITCFIDKNRINIIKKKTEPVGIDMGILNQITLSNSIEIKYQVPVATKKLRRLHKLTSKKKKHSSNGNKARIELAREYEYYNNQKQDIKNKIVHILKTDFSRVVFQDDNIKAWQRIWGKRMLNTAIGGITEDLKRIPTSVKVSRWFASTKECPICKHKQKVGLDERVFVCEHCGYTKDRDWKSAECILEEGMKQIGAEYTQFKPMESDSPTSILERFNAIPRVEARLLCEVGSLRL